MDTGFLQAFLLINAVLIGIVAAVATRHAYAHFRPDKHDAEKHPAQPQVKLSPAVREELLEEAKQNYQKILDNAAGQLQLDLSRTSASLNKQLDTLGQQIVTDEMKRYKASLEELQKNTEVSITSTQNQLAEHQEDLKTAMAEHQKQMMEKLKQEIEAEKQQLITQIDSKLADAAASFLIETLQHNVDLGAQTAYLTSMIEEHKEDFKKEVGHEGSAS
jgi:F0F1-type ATP synthase membrane subunit b/b'